MNKIITIIFSLFILLSCNDDDIDYGQIVDEPYQLEIPSYFPKITFDTDKYPLTKNGVELGKNYFMKVDYLEIILFHVLFAIFKKMPLLTTDILLVMELMID